MKNNKNYILKNSNIIIFIQHYMIDEIKWIMKICDALFISELYLELFMLYNSGRYGSSRS